MYEQEIAVVDAIRGAFEKFKHYKEFSKRCKKFLEEALPAYTVSVDTSFALCPSYKIQVWGNGIDYNNCVNIHWNDRNDKGEYIGWQAGLTRALDIADSRDCAERVEQEEKLLHEFERLNKEVIERMKAARLMVSLLPVPASATVRKESYFWERPSYELRKKFPLLFDTDID